MLLILDQLHEFIEIKVLCYLILSYIILQDIYGIITNHGKFNIQISNHLQTILRKQTALLIHQKLRT